MMAHHQFRTFKNSFSDGTTTLQTISRMLALHPEYYDALAEHDLENSLFTGLQPSPLFEIFHHNGYTSSTYSIDSYFGYKVGPFTNHRPGDNDTLCFNQLTPIALKFSFYGYCQIIIKEKKDDLLINIKTTSFSAQSHQKLSDSRLESYIDFLLLKINQAQKSGQPFIFFPYIRSPKHIARAHSGDEEHVDAFKHEYSRKIEQETPIVIDRLVSNIKENDPNAIILIMGDHGIYLTWNIIPQFGGFMAANQSIRNLAIWDRMAVVSAIYPPDICSTYLSQESGDLMEKYAVHTMVLRQLIRCLSGGDDPIIGNIDYRIYDSKNKNQKSEHHGYMYPKDQPGRYEDYLYEFPNRMTNIVIPMLAE